MQVSESGMICDFMVWMYGKEKIQLDVAGGQRHIEQLRLFICKFNLENRAGK